MKKYLFFLMFFAMSLLKAEDTSNVYLKTVTVTSAKRFESRFDVPQSVELISDLEITKFVQNGLADFNNKIAGVSFSSDGIWGANPIIRGLSANNSQIYIDGVRVETSNEISAAASLFQSADIEKIEILKGAVNSYYGSGAVGGIINIFTKSANFSDFFQQKLSLSTGYNSNNKLNYHNFTYLFSNNDFKGKIYLGQRNAENAKNSKSEINNSFFKDKSVSGNLSYKFDNFVFSTNIQYYLGDDIGIPGTGSLFPANAKVFYDKISRNLYNFSVSYNNISANIPYVKLNLGLQNIERYVNNYPNTPSTNTAKAKITTEKIYPVGKHFTKSFNLESSYILNSNNNLVFGLDFWRRDLKTYREKYIRIDSLNTSGQIFKTSKRYVYEIPIPKSNYNNYGLWFSFKNENSLLQDLSTELAGRLDFVHIENDYVKSPQIDQIDNISVLNPTTQLVWKEQKNNNNSYSISLNNSYKLNDENKINLNISKTYRIPNLEERYQYIEQGNIVKLGNIDLKPEEGLYFEFNFKHYDGNIQSILSFYRYDFKNLVTDEFRKSYYNGKDAYVKTNIGKAYLEGVDFDINYSITDYLKTNTNFSFTVGKDKNTKKYLPKIPPANGSFGIILNFLNNAKLYYDFQYALRAMNVPSSEPNTSSYIIHNIAIDYNYNLFGNEIYFLVGCNNIFDKLYKNHLSTYRGYFNYEMGRNIYGKLKLEI